MIISLTFLTGLKAQTIENELKNFQELKLYPQEYINKELNSIVNLKMSDIKRMGNYFSIPVYSLPPQIRLLFWASTKFCDGWGDKINFIVSEELAKKIIKSNPSQGLYEVKIHYVLYEQECQQEDPKHYVAVIKKIGYLNKMNSEEIIIFEDK